LIVIRGDNCVIPAVLRIECAEKSVSGKRARKMRCANGVDGFDDGCEQFAFFIAANLAAVRVYA